MASVPASPFSPHLYFLDARLVGPLDAWPAWFERIASLGFDHVLIGAFSAAGSAGHPRVVADHDRPADSLATDLDTAGALARLAEQAREFDLKLMLDVTVDRVAVEHPLRKTAPTWYVERHHDDARIDPRTAAFEQTVAYADVAQPDVADALAGWWHGRFATLSAAGVAGFLIDAPQRLPAAWWRTWLGSRHGELHDVRWLAGIPGHAREALGAFEGAGFDGVFSSLRWWDLRAPWLVDEHALLRRVGSPIAFPDAFDGPRLAHDLRGLPPDAVERGYRRALETAAALGTGWLVPMGFERGVATPLMTAHPQPAAFREAFEHAPFDLSEALAEANRRRSASPVFASRGELAALSGADASATVLLRGDAPSLERADDALLIALNPELDVTASVDPACLAGVPGAFTRFAPLSAGRRAKTAPLGALALMPGDVTLLRAARAKPVKPGKDAKADGKTANAASDAGEEADTTANTSTAGEANRRRARSSANAALSAALAADRIAIERVEPSVDGGRFAAKRVVGEQVEVRATLIADGHAKLGAAVAWRAADEAAWREAPLAPLGNDRWRAWIPLDRLGRHLFRVLAWRDDWGSLVVDIGKKHAAGQDITLELQEVRALLAGALDGLDGVDTGRKRGKNAKRDGEAPASASDAALADARRLAKEFDAADAAGQLALVLAEPSAAIYAALGRRTALTQDPTVYPIEAERRAARFGSWYEMFPRSASDDVNRHGTFEDVARHLPRIREMGFDVLYFPPIHPIGLTARKGRNNSLRAGPEDVGSPYAIGSPIGGHDELHPSLGTLGAFRTLVAAAHEHGIEIALDFAVQCSPDHPWLARHPGWFAWRPDGSLRFAENPPKRYQDIVNPDFYAPDAIPELWTALRDVILHWVDAGVKLFRVDNPHTKPLPFWAWMIEEVRTRHPDVVFLSEAFTRPAMMYRLAKLGFSQSYTYFTWRETKHELREYLTELADGPARDFFRPNFFVNTPDINPHYLHHAPRAQFVIRAALAALLSGVWGMYSGFEIGESAPLADGGEEYRDSEKYELRARDWKQPGHLSAEIALLNRVRRSNPALQTHLGIRFLESPNDSVLVFRKATPTGDNVIVAAVSLDPWAPQATDFMLDRSLYETWGVAEGAALRSVDLASGHTGHWHGTRQYVNLDPHALPFAIWRIAPDAPRTRGATPGHAGEGDRR
ncbi:maltotransferase domain-containing protein [Burkholderia sp. 22PA0106]|uniref:maltotransferase domain-containing protein n=1 Tax=Burkholderia sp. 22PA0106 TaxID=3237371 RepID=UPI0039C47D14